MDTETLYSVYFILNKWSKNEELTKFLESQVSGLISLLCAMEQIISLF